MFKFLVLSKGHFIIESGSEPIFSSIHRWMFHSRKKKIVFMTDIDNTLWVVYYSPDRFMSCPFHNNVERINIMDDSDGFFVVGKDETKSFYSISDIIEQINRSMFPVITPILSSNAILVGNRYVASYKRVEENETDVQIFDTTTQQMMASLRMNGMKMRGCQLIQDDTVFFIYTDIECLYISVDSKILLRSPVEIIGNIIFVQKKIEGGFEVYLFDIRKNEIVGNFLIQGERLEFNHVLTIDGSIVFRALTNSSDLEIVV